MLLLDRHLFPASLDEASDILRNSLDSVILGGCGYLRLGERKIGTGIDLSRLGLDTISETADKILVGAMATLRLLETDPITARPFAGVLPKAVRDIVGIQLRSCVTVGGTIAGRYPFSDPICAFLALDAEVLLHHAGIVTLADFLAAKPPKDIVTGIAFPKAGRAGGKRVASFASVRKTRTDYAVLNVAASRLDDDYRIVVGSRPGRAVLVPEAAEFLAKNGLDESSAAAAAKIAADNLQFGDNPRGSGRYRRAICPILVKRALLEVLNAG